MTPPLTAVNALSLTDELIPKTGSIRQSFTALTSVIPFGFLRAKK